ncbi:MAG: AbrB/MazE/SpoVT family DNA-binding domain-containing protein [Candidatus Nitrosopolaris sp.]
MTKEVTNIFLSGWLSSTLIIPIEIARRHGLDQPSHVIVEETPDGILIRRLELNLKKGEFV